MRKIILNLAVSLDGMIEGPNGEYDWCIMDDDIDFDKFLDQTDIIFYGRKSYEMLAAQQTELIEDEAMRTAVEVIKNKPAYVFSRTIPHIDNAKVISDNIAEHVKALKDMPGNNIWLYGGASLVSTFIKEGLIDEYQLAVHPIALTSGKPLFENIGQRVPLRLIKTESYKSGVVILYYQPELP